MSRSELGIDSTFDDPTAFLSFLIRRVLASPVLDFCPVSWLTRDSDLTFVDAEVFDSNLHLLTAIFDLFFPAMVLIVRASRP